MIKKEKLNNALYALQALMVHARSMAHEKVDHKLLAELLDDSLSKISQITQFYQPKNSVLRLFDLVKLPNGSFMDDVSVIVVKPVN